MDRRGFLRGSLLTAPAVLLGGNIQELLPDGQKDAQVAVLDSPAQQEVGTDHIYRRLDRRLNAHVHFFGEMPKGFFLSAAEFDEYNRALTPTTRYMSNSMAVGGLDSLMFRGVPVATVDRGILFFSPSDPI
jgi:hypothetical protein